MVYVVIFDRLKGIFSGSKCEKWVHYDTNSLTIQGLSADVAPIKFSLADFQTEAKKLREASELSELLDNYQYQLCRICNELGKEDEEWKKYIAIRTGMINLLTSFQGSLIALKNDPQNQATKINEIVEKLQDYVLLVNREILPNIEDLGSKTTVSKGDVPKVDPSAVAKAIELSGLDVDEINKFIEELI